MIVVIQCRFGKAGVNILVVVFGRVVSCMARRADIRLGWRALRSVGGKFNGRVLNRSKVIGRCSSGPGCIVSPTRARRNIGPLDRVSNKMAPDMC